MADDLLLGPDASEAELAASVEGHLHALFRLMAGMPGAEIVETPHVTMHNAPFDNPMFRGVWRTRMSEGEADEEIERTLDWFGERNAPYVFWWTGPGTTPVDLGQRLKARGLVPFELDAPGMVATIAELDTGVLERGPDGLTIEMVQDDEGLDTFAAELIAAFGMPDWAANSWAEATRSFGIVRAPWRLYLARIDGQPVGTAMRFNGGGVAAVLAIGVREAYRGQGIGAAVTLRPLLDAQDEGLIHAALFATPLGEPVYARLGFRRCNAPISRYLWRGDAS